MSFVTSTVTTIVPTSSTPPRIIGTNNEKDNREGTSFLAGGIHYLILFLSFTLVTTCAVACILRRQRRRLLALKNPVFEDLENMKESMRSAVKEAMALLTNPEYFMETEPGSYNASGYFISCRGTTVQDDSTEKRLQNEWTHKVIPALKGSKEEILRLTGARLDKTWKVEKRYLQDRLNIHSKSL
ncbi:unnamed protein product [Mortierella alpina]